MDTKKQARAPKSVIFGEEAFNKTDNTIIRWLGNAGALINSHGTTIMIDPLLLDFSMPLLIDIPVKTKDVPNLDAVIITHCDGDHYDPSTCKSLASVCKEFHSTQYVAELMRDEGLNSLGHNIGNKFSVGSIDITLTAADHAWQNEHSKYTRVYKFEDYCGFWIDTPNGSIWVPGDSRLLEEHLQMPTPDAMLFDFSDNSWHIGLKGAIKLANNYPDTPLLLYHWGSVDAPHMDAFNGNPDDLIKAVINPNRVKIIAPGEPYILTPLKKCKKNL